MARRSARLGSARQQTPIARATPSAARLGSVLERDESEGNEEPQSIDYVVNNPATTGNIKQQLKRLSTTKTPTTELKPDRGEMNPKTIHQNIKEQDSGFKLGFVDVQTQGRRSIASLQNTPSRANMTSPQSAPAFKFTSGSEGQLSNEAQQLMDNLREEAARIKAKMQMEKETQDRKDGEADQIFVNAAGRRIAMPSKSKAGRFSDVHMAQFKKMDSIANHASSFRTKPGFAKPTAQSLKRSGSKAGLDEPERPRTAGKGTPGRAPPPFVGRPSSASPFKSIPPSPADGPEDSSPAKRQRRSAVDDVSSAKFVEHSVRPSNIPKSVPGTWSSPTKSSLARNTTASNGKPSMLPRSQSTKSLRRPSQTLKSRSSSASVGRFTSKLIEAQNEARESSPTAISKPLPSLPTSRPIFDRVPSTPQVVRVPKSSAFSSRLPTFSGLKSILRSTRKASTTKPVERPGTPKRPNASNGLPESSKKVDFTPSVKSRYAVKLAAASPSPAKLDRSSSTSRPSSSFSVQFDPAAYTVAGEVDDAWEDGSSLIEYPTLPRTLPVDHTITRKAKELDRRESKTFKSIFTTLGPAQSKQPTSLTTVNTLVHEANPETHAKSMLASPISSPTKPSPSTIRHVRTSGVTDLVQPFDDTSVRTMPHGLPGKKRQRQSVDNNDHFGTDDDAKENRRFSVMPSVPGGWEESMLDDGADADDEGVKRGGKKPRRGRSSLEKPKEVEKPQAGGVRQSMSPVKKSAVREQAVKSAKERKGKSPGMLSMSRLNALSRPKQR